MRNPNLNRLLGPWALRGAPAKDSEALGEIFYFPNLDLLYYPTPYVVVICDTKTFLANRPKLMVV
jgi:hypothetical protein